MKIQTWMMVLSLAMVAQSDTVERMDSSFLEEDEVLARGVKDFYLKVDLDFTGLVEDIRVTLEMIKQFQHIPKMTTKKLFELRKSVHTLVDLKTTRSKRGALALIGIGLGLYNRMDLMSVHQSLRSLNANQKKIDQNIHMVSKGVKVNARAINLTVDAIEQLFSRNLLIQEEIRTLKVDMLLSEDVRRMNSIVTSLDHIRSYNRWGNCVLNEDVVSYLAEAKEDMHAKGLNTLEMPLEDIPVSVIPTKRGVELLFHMVVFSSFWKVHYHMSMETRLMDLTQTRLAMANSKKQWLTLSEGQWSKCQRWNKVAFCENANYEESDVDDCLAALWFHRPRKVQKHCAIRPESTRDWRVVEIRSTAVFVEVTKTVNVTIRCHDQSVKRSLTAGGYQIHPDPGCEVQIKSWKWSRPGAVYEKPLKLRPSLSPVGDLELNLTVSKFKMMHLLRPTPLAALETLEKVDTAFHIGWQLTLIISLVCIAVVALAVAYLVYKFKSSKKLVSSEGSRIAPVHEGLIELKDKLKDLV